MAVGHRIVELPFVTVEILLDNAKLETNEARHRQTAYRDFVNAWTLRIYRKSAVGHGHSVLCDILKSVHFSKFAENEGRRLSKLLFVLLQVLLNSEKSQTIEVGHSRKGFSQLFRKLLLGRRTSNC